MTMFRTAIFTVITGAAMPVFAGDMPDPLRALGNEPGWSLNVSGGAYHFTTMDGEDAKGPITASEDGLNLTADGMAVELLPEVCRDAMSGMPFPLTVSVERGEKTYFGCGGEPVSLLAGDWTITEVAETAVTLPASISFTADAVSGNSGCNRFNGGFQLTGEGLSFVDMAATRMACPEPEMKLEQSIFETLPTISRFDISPEGDLILFAGDTAALKARR